MSIRTLLRYIGVFALCLAAFVVQRTNAAGVQATVVPQINSELRDTGGEFAPRELVLDTNQ